MSQSLPCSHSNKTSLPQLGCQCETMVSDKGHWDGGEDRRQRHPAKALLVLFSRTRPIPRLEAGTHLSAHHVPIILSMVVRAGCVLISI